MATFIYIMCAATSLACAVLLMRGYRQNGVALLLWSGLCFIGLAGSNALLVIDLVVVPDIDFSIPRNLLTIGGLTILVYGLIWETQ